MNFFLTFYAIVLTSIFTQTVFPLGDLDSLVNNAIRVSLVHLEKSINEVGDTALFPSYGTKDLRWKLTTREEWTSGFYPGCLWYAFELSNDIQFKLWARQWTNSLEPEKNNPYTHDLGFKFMCTFGKGFQLDKESSCYKDILLSAAKTLSERYDSTIRCLSSNWDNKKTENSFPVIIDIMMNLELLFWASENGGPHYYTNYAINHAIKTGNDFLRQDGSTYHIVRYNKNSGEVLNKGTIQGQGDETTWARGHAWGFYGMVVVYRYTRDKQFLNWAIKLVDYFIKNLQKDNISPWDFNSEKEYRDVSATCIVTSALFEITNYLDDESHKNFYLTEAEAMLESLCKEPYFLGNKATNCLLNHSVHYLPINSNVDVPSIFADYYFLEALYRYKNLK